MLITFMKTFNFFLSEFPCLLSIQILTGKEERVPLKSKTGLDLRELYGCLLQQIHRYYQPSLHYKLVSFI